MPRVCQARGSASCALGRSLRLSRPSRLFTRRSFSRPSRCSGNRPPVCPCLSILLTFARLTALCLTRFWLLSSPSLTSLRLRGKRLAIFGALWSMVADRWRTRPTASFGCTIVARGAMSAPSWVLRPRLPRRCSWSLPRLSSRSIIWDLLMRIIVLTSSAPTSATALTRCLARYSHQLSASRGCSRSSATVRHRQRMTSRVRSRRCSARGCSL